MRLVDEDERPNWVPMTAEESAAYQVVLGDVPTEFPTVTSCERWGRLGAVQVGAPGCGCPMCRRDIETRAEAARKRAGK